MKKITIALVLFSTFCIGAAAQKKIDSLKIVLSQLTEQRDQLETLDDLTKQMIRKNHSEQKEYISQYITLAKELGEYDLMASKSRFLIQQYIYSRDHEKAMKLCDSMLSYESKFKTVKPKAHVLLKRAAAYYNKSNFQKAIKDYNESAEFFLKTKDSIYAADAFYFAAQVQIDIKEYVIAVNNYEKAYDIYHSLNDIDYVIYTKLALAALYNRMGFERKSINEREGLIKLVRSRKDYDQMSLLLFGNANSYYKLKEYKKQKEYTDLMNANKDSISNKSIKSQSHLLVEISYSNYYLSIDNLKEAKKYIARANEKLVLTESPIYYTRMLQLIEARYYKKTGNIQKAQVILESFFKNSESKPSVDELMKSQELLSEIYHTTKKYRKANELLVNNLKAKDSIYEFNKLNAFLYNQSKFETAIKEKEILKQEVAINQLESEKTLSESRRNTLLAILFSVVLVFFGIWRKGRLRRKQMALELDRNKHELKSFTLQLVQKSDEQKLLKGQLEYLQKENQEEESLGVIKDLVDSKILTKEDWVLFKEKFLKVYPHFFIKIAKEGYSLTKSEERLIALEKLELDTEEISNMLGVSLKTVFMSRYRLRKKINAPKEISLITYFEKAS